MSEISIIIPTYNCAKYISEAIESVLAQTYKDYEIIVVNDGSTDNAETIIKNIFKKLKEGECKYIYQENQGSANARNRAIKESEGEYIAWLDQDDIWLPNRLEKGVAVLDRDRRLGIVGGLRQDVDESGNRLFTKPHEKYENGLVNFYLFPFNRISSGSTLIRREIFINHDLWFRQEFFPSDDYFLWLKVSLLYRIFVIPEVVYLYRIHIDNFSLDNGRINERTISAHAKAIREVFDIELDVHIKRYWSKSLDSRQEWDSFVKACRKICNIYLSLDFFTKMEKLKIMLYYDALLYGFWESDRDLLSDIFLKRLKDVMLNPKLYFGCKFMKGLICRGK